MSKLFRVAAFIVVFMAANEGLCRAYYRLASVANPGAATVAVLPRYPDRYETLFFGDSVIATGVDPRRIPNSYNFSWLGANYRENYFTLDWILRSDPQNLKVAVIQMDRHSFSGRRMQNFRFIHKASFGTVFRADHRDRQRGGYILEWAQSRLVPYSGVVDRYQSWTRNKLPERHDGYMPLRDATRREHAMNRVVAKQTVAKLLARKHWFEPRMRWYLEEMIRLLTDRGVRVVLVHTPVSAVFDRAIESRVSDEAFGALVESIRLAHPDCVFLDHQDLYADRDSMFWNPNHLVTEGAAAWSDRLRSDLVRHGLMPG